MDGEKMSGWISYVENGKKSKGEGSERQPFSEPSFQHELCSSEGKNEHVLPASKWTREDDETDDELKRDARDLELSYSSPGSENAGDDFYKNVEVDLTADASNSAAVNVEMNEEQRRKLRRLEVALMEYRESLEEKGFKSSEEMEKKVAIHRRLLQSEYGLFDLSADVSGKKRSSLDRGNPPDEYREQSKKHQAIQIRSKSPHQKQSSQDRYKESNVRSDREGRREREKGQDLGSERAKDRTGDREKNGNRDRNDHEREKARDRKRVK